MYIGRDFKRDIELDNLYEDDRYLRPNRGWLDLFSLSLSNDFCYYNCDFTILTDNLNADEVIVINSHDDIFKAYQIQYWRKDSIFGILPAIKCPSFKSETKIYKTSEMKEMREFIYDQNHTKSIVIDYTDEKLSLNLVYGNTIKITPRTFCSFQKTKFLDKLNERYELWEIGDCAWKPKKIRVWEDNFKSLKHIIDKLKWISNIIDEELGMHNFFEFNYLPFSNYDTMVFNHSDRQMSYSVTNLIFTGDTLAAVYDGNYYNFRLDQRTKESKDSYIKGNL